jgi:hypothetical protein
MMVSPLLQNSTPVAQTHDGGTMDRRTRRLSRFIFWLAAAAEVGWAGIRITFRRRRLPLGLPPLYYDPFVRELEEHGRYVLPCGGGVICEPDRAIKELRREYGPADLCDRCFSLLFEQPPDAQYPEGIDSTALGIVFRLGNQPMLRKLVEMRQRLLQLPAVTQPAAGWRRQITPLEHCDLLIAGLCHRLHQSLPAGIPPLTASEISNIF